MWSQDARFLFVMYALFRRRLCAFICECCVYVSRGSRDSALPASIFCPASVSFCCTCVWSPLVASCLIQESPGHQQELDEIRKSGSRCFQSVKANDTNVLLWQGLLVPDHHPYDKGAFSLEISFPADYPFKPPKVTFKTKIYHPNVDEKGQVCLPIISPDNWKPATKTIQVIQSLIGMIREPELEHPLRAELAEEYSKDRRKFLKNAEEHTRKFSEKRPVD